VIATNDSYKQVAIERGGVPAEKITVVRNGPDLDRIRPTAPDAAPNITAANRNPRIAMPLQILKPIIIC